MSKIVDFRSICLNCFLSLATALLLISLFSCRTNKRAYMEDEQRQKPAQSAETPTTNPSIEPARPNLSTPNPNTKRARGPVWAPKQHGYKPSKTRLQDLLHTKLAVSFDWEKQYLYGKANLQLKQHFYPSDSVILDAKGFTINSVALIKNGQQKPLQYRYDSVKIYIQLDKVYPSSENVELFIDYTAKPNELEAGGSAAITSDKGLYFINADGKNPKKPKQIWTQGEPEASSCWFPTIDATNERCTQEVYITVEKGYTTLSNGILVNSTNNPDGTRTDYWRMDMPHAPYLFMMAVGNFAVVKDKWRNIEVSYYVEPDYAKHANMIFGNTPEMLEFFSKRLGVDYPWQKYSQVVVRDFVSGAMENTTATIHMEGLQHDHREHVDETHEDYIAHELFHHWFGDYLTCESWANLPLNEAFATYGEYLWIEHKYGKDEADYHLSKDIILYLEESVRKREPLIRYQYNKPDDMFDRHSYQKGSCVLHLLRQYLGDDAFFEGVKQYLVKHALSDVEIDELRMSFEDVSGQDLHWFFDQWFMKPGHPQIEANISYQPEQQRIAIRARQYQDQNFCPLFKLPMTVQVELPGKTTLHPIVYFTQDSTFYIPATSAPLNVIFDSQQTLVGQLVEDKPMDYWTHQLKNGKNFRQKQSALYRFLQDLLKAEPEQASRLAARQALSQSINDPFWSIRESSIGLLSAVGGDSVPEAVAAITRMATADKKSDVRLAAIEFLASLPEGAVTPAIQEVFKTALKDSSYRIVAAGLNAIQEIDSALALQSALQLRETPASAVRLTVADILLANKHPEAISFASKCLLESNGMDIQWQLAQALIDAVEQNGKGPEHIPILQQVIRQSSSDFVARYVARFMREQYAPNHPQVQQFLDDWENTKKNSR
jgi:aminopeptidase N